MAEATRANASDLPKAVRDRLAQYQNAGGTRQDTADEFWSPENHGDELIGFVEGSFDAKYGPGVRVRDDDNVLHAVGLNADLQQKISHRQVGHWIAIVYVSDLDTGKGNPMKVYEVFDFGPDRPADLLDS